MSIRYSFLFLCACIVGCVDDVPHDNPLDPLSPSYKKEGSLQGRVFITNQPTSVPGAAVNAIDDGISVSTDSSGSFGFAKLSSGSHRFVCMKNNFTNDTFTVTIEPGITSQVSLGLNGAPVVVSQTILTRKIDQYFPSPEYFIDVAASVTDPNGVNDLASVWFTVDTLQFPLTFSPTTQNFVATIFKSKFPTNTIQWLVGKPLHIVSKDKSNAVNISDPFYVTRVIESAAVPVSPPYVNSDTASSTPLFKWSPPNVTFNFTYTLTVSVAGTQSSVWTYEGLTSINEQMQYPGSTGAPPLPAGNYLWSVSVVDDFGNYARSKEASFIVK